MKWTKIGQVKQFYEQTNPGTPDLVLDLAWSLLKLVAGKQRRFLVSRRHRLPARVICSQQTQLDL